MKEHIGRRRFIRQATLLGISPWVAPLCSGLANQPSPYSVCNNPAGRPIHRGTYLFIDDELLAFSRGVERVVHPAMKADRPVLQASSAEELEEPIDGTPVKRLYVYGSVLRDPESGQFRLWYHSAKNAFVAVSEDGINWQRPNLGFFGKSNRIELFGLKSISLIDDSMEPDRSKRYKLLGHKRGGYYAAYSADGLVWHLYSDRPVLASSDTITLAQDPHTGEYLAFHKYQLDGKGLGRRVFLSLSRDMQHWTTPKLVMQGDEADRAEASKLTDGTHVEFYNMSAFYYANQWIGFATRFRRTGEPKVVVPPVKGRKLQSMNDGVIDVVLTVSNDGQTWQRCPDRNPVIPVGPYAYDAGTILGVCNTPVYVNNEVWLYYTGLTTTHGGAIPQKENSICVARWRRDGFVSLAANATEGVIETHPFLSSGQQLYLNIEAKEGLLTVEAITPEGKSLKGYRAAEFLPVKGDQLSAPACWKKHKLLPKGQLIKLRFTLTNCHFYSFTLKE